MTKNNPELKLIYSKKIQTISPLWIRKSLISAIISIVTSTFALLIFVGILVYIFAIFNQYLRSNGFELLIICIVGFLITWSIGAIPHFLFALNNYRSKEIYKSLFLISFCQIFIFLAIIFCLIIMTVFAIFYVSMISNYDDSIIVVGILGHINKSAFISLLIIFFVLITILLLALIIQASYSTYYLVKFAFYKRIIHTDSNSKYQWIDNNYIKEKYSYQKPKNEKN